MKRKIPRRHPGGRRPALLIVDLLNAFDFPEGAALLRRTVPVARRIARLKAAARAAGVPVIYANDNFGKWRSDRDEVIRRSLAKECRGAPVAKLLEPDDEDYFVLKPKHSAFFSTTLETLLADLRADSLIVVGVAGNICVLHTAFDAHVRDIPVAVPSDGIASNSTADHAAAVRTLRRALRADTRPIAARIRALARRRRGRRRT